MKITKRITKLVLVLSLFIITMSMTAQAASGVVSFTDPSTEAGVEFTVDIAIKSDSTPVEFATIVMTYDTEKVQFVSGTDVTASGSTLTYDTVGDGSSVKLRTTMTFLALKEGEAKITIDSVEATDVNGDELPASEGNSTITIQGGTEVEPTVPEEPEGTEVPSAGDMESDGLTIDGVTYVISDTLESTDKVELYTESTIDYNGTTYPSLVGDTSGITLVKLVNSAGEGAMYCYDSSADTFWPYVQMKISDSTYIVLVRDEFAVELPTNYQLTTLTVNGYVFPTWQDTTNTGYYLLNAINSLGEMEAYQFDSQDETYQRFVIPEVVVEEEVTPEGFIGKALTFLETYLILVLMVLGVVLLFVFILIIVLSVKLRNRNVELDDLYDEYVINGEKSAVSQPKSTTQTSGGRSSDKKLIRELEPMDEFDDEYDEFDDEFDDEYDDDYDELDDEFNDDYEDEEFDDYEDDDYDDYEDEEFDDYEDEEFDDYEDDEYDDNYEDEEFDDYEDDDFDDTPDEDFNIDDYEELRTANYGIRNRKLLSQDKKIDFIDLD